MSCYVTLCFNSLEIRHLITPAVRLVTGKPRNLLSASLPALGLQGYGATPAFFSVGTRHLDSEPHACAASALTHCAIHFPGLRSTGFFPEYSCGNGT